MVTFKELEASGQKYLLIVDHVDDADESGTKLLVHTPIHGNFVGTWPQYKHPHQDNWSLEVPQNDGTTLYSLKSFIHTKKPRTTTFQTLGERITSGDVHWGSSLRLNGEFVFIEKYWEWLEDILGRSKQTLRNTSLYDALYASLFTYDRHPNIVRAFCEAWCPETNTLHTSVGELSISLWDLHRIGGLSMTGGMYEEVIPCAEELTGLDDRNVRYIPQSCEYLFAAFHYLQKEESNKSGVRVSNWIDFWFDGNARYPKPKPRRLKKASRPQSTQNPTGAIGQPSKLPTHRNSVFNILGIKTHLREEAYLAAFISTWLCVFALPCRDLHFIRPTTFKAASMLAFGRRTCLAMPVLLSIYKGLNKIGNSPTPGHSNASFPVHYVYAWLAHYFSTHYLAPEALPAPMMTNFSGEGGARYYDENEARNLIHKGDKAKWSVISLVRTRSELFVDNGRLSDAELCYFFSARSNYLVLHIEDKFLVEPYSPYRFARQFGFYQDIPKELGADVRSTNYELCRTLWRTLTRHKSNEKLLFPASPSDANKHISPNFQTWWSRTHDKYVLEKQNTLVAGHQSTIDHGEPKGKELAQLVEASKRNDALEAKKKTTKNARNEKKDSKGTEDKASTPKGLTCNEIFPKDTSRRISSIVIRANAQEDSTSHKKKRDNSFVEDNEGSNNSDQHWKRKKSKITTQALDTNDLESQKFFEDIPTALVSDISQPHILNDLSLEYIGDQDASQGSVDGPTIFDLLAKQVGTSTQFEDTGDSTQKATSEGIQTLDSASQKERTDIQPTSKERKLKVFEPTRWPRQPQASEFCPENVILDCRREYIQMLWDNLKEQISSRTLEHMTSLESKARSIMEEMCSSNIKDLSPLQGLLTTFFTNVARYDSTKSMLSQKIPAESYDKSLADAIRCLNDAETLAKQQAEKILFHKTKLADIDREEAQLKKRLELLDVQRKETLPLVRKDEEELSETQSNVENLRTEVNRIENSTPLLAEESETLEKMKELLETSRKELTEFKL